MESRRCAPRYAIACKQMRLPCRCSSIYTSIVDDATEGARGLSRGHYRERGESRLYTARRLHHVSGVRKEGVTRYWRNKPELRPTSWEKWSACTAFCGIG